jgi:rare lipoprotein A
VTTASAPRIAWLCLPMALFAFGCARQQLKPDAHFFLGKPYQAGPIWYYPRESFDLDETGLARVSKDDTARLTADGEVFDQTALAVAHPTLQLPAIARLTNLENGRAVTVRINDRGPGDPHRLIEVTRRTAALLNISPDGTAGSGTARVRLQVLPAESHAAADALPGAPSLAIATAPRGSFEVAELAPPPGVRQGNGRALPAARVTEPEREQAATPPMRMAETVTQTQPKPGRLMVRLDTFDDYQYAAVQRAKMTGASARIVPVFEGRSHRFMVEVGPLADVPQADGILDRALAAGIPDARIVVE